MSETERAEDLTSAQLRESLEIYKSRVLQLREELVTAKTETRIALAAKRKAEGKLTHLELKYKAAKADRELIMYEFRLYREDHQ